MAMMDVKRSHAERMKLMEKDAKAANAVAKTALERLAAEHERELLHLQVERRNEKQSMADGYNQKFESAKARLQISHEEELNEVVSKLLQEKEAHRRAIGRFEAEQPIRFHGGESFF